MLSPLTWNCQDKDVTGISFFFFLLQLFSVLSAILESNPGQHLMKSIHFSNVSTKSEGKKARKINDGKRTAVCFIHGNYFEDINTYGNKQSNFQHKKSKSNKHNTVKILVLKKGFSSTEEF